MIKVRFSFLLAIITGGLLSLIASCNSIDKDINPNTTPDGQTTIATDDKAQVLPGGSVVIDLLKNDKIATNASISLLKDYLKQGTAKFIKQGVVLYTTNATSGTDVLAYTVCPPGQPCDTGAININISADTSNTPCAGAMPDSVSTTISTPVDMFVLQNDRFCDSTATDSTVNDSSSRVLEIVESPTNGNVTVKGNYLTYVPNQGFKGTDQLIYGVRNASANNYLGYGVATIFVGDSTSNPQDTTSNCTPQALNDSYTFSGDSLSSQGQYVYLNVLQNDSLCNDSLGKIIINNGGLNTPPVFENDQLKVKLYPTDGTVQLQYGLTQNGNTVSQAFVTINVTQTDSSNCIVNANSDSFSVQKDSLASGGTYKYIDVLSNDELCNQQFTYEITNTGGFNDVSFENGRIKVKLYSSDVGTFTIRYALKQNNAIRSETDVTVVIQ